MSEKWRNEELASIEVSDKVKWVLQNTTMPDGQMLIGVRKFVETRAGLKPTASGLSVAKSNKDELKAIIKLLQQGLTADDEVADKQYVIKADDEYLVSAKGKLKWSASRDKALVMSKSKAQKLKAEHDAEDWKLLVRKV